MNNSEEIIRRLVFDQKISSERISHLLDINHLAVSEKIKEMELHWHRRFERTYNNNTGLKFYLSKNESIYVVTAFGHSCTAKIIKWWEGVERRFYQKDVEYANRVLHFFKLETVKLEKELEQMKNNH